VPTHEAIVRSGGQAVFTQCDVTRIGDFEKAIALAVREFGSVDILVNNAGVFTGLASIFDESEGAFDQAIAVNLKGVWNGCKAMATHLRDEGRPGRIINIASVGGIVGIGNEPGYCATKGAVVNMTRAIALDCAEHRIAVNAVAPGFIVTGMVREFVEQPEVLEVMRQATPWPRFGKPEDVAEVCAFLAAEGSDWMTGAVIPVDGGFTAK
jgi:NAD(P)-dependent dehydrogenase (short-subunit alcohol dehydrogenase family)